MLRGLLSWARYQILTNYCNQVTVSFLSFLLIIFSLFAFMPIFSHCILSPFPFLSSFSPPSRLYFFSSPHFFCTVDCRLFVTWFNDISDLTSRFLWSQIFTSFCNVNFTGFNDTWYNSQTWFKVIFFRSLGNFFPDLVHWYFSLFMWFEFSLKLWCIIKLLKKYTNDILI